MQISPDAATWAQFAANIAQAFSFPLALILYFTEVTRRRREREYGTYDALDDKYIDYLKLCIEFPHLDTFRSTPSAPPLAKDDRSRRLAMFHILISICERAYLMYSDQSTAVKTAQWSGWRAFIISWSENQPFVELWPENSPQYDANFVAYVNELIALPRS